MVSCCLVAEQWAVAHDHFWEIVRRPVRFRQTIELLEQSGPHRYIDLGPSGTLATFVKYHGSRSKQSEAVALMTRFGGTVRNLARMRA
jgi:malonyl CoA-acyl carrier protein transacylase